MEIKLNLKDLEVDTSGALVALGNHTNQFTGKELWAITKATQKIKKMEKTRVEIVETLQNKYGEKDENGKLIVKNGLINIPNVPAYNKEAKEIESEQEEVVITLPLIKSTDNLKLSVHHLLILDNLGIIENEGSTDIEE